ncbi:hypothetical protein L0337_43230 [candidate division KSB1 bacterium]|nr:hypothetical protein [candidate division KSB1 bacterium]
METMQIQLPLPLAQRIRQEADSNEALSRIVAEAIQSWLDNVRKDKVDREKVLKTLRDAGLIMSSERQRAFAQAMISSLPLRDTPTRAHVEAALAKLKVPLSEEIITMRGDR